MNKLPLTKKEIALLAEVVNCILEYLTNFSLHDAISTELAQKLYSMDGIINSKKFVFKQSDVDALKHIVNSFLIRQVKMARRDDAIRLITKITQASKINDYTMARCTCCGKLAKASPDLPFFENGKQPTYYCGCCDGS